MAILQSALVEPLLSRQQAAVVRDIARVTQLTEAFRSLTMIESTFDVTSNKTLLGIIGSNIDCTVIKSYLAAEVKRVLMQIRTPAPSVGSSKDDTTTPGNKTM